MKTSMVFIIAAVIALTTVSGFAGDDHSESKGSRASESARNDAYLKECGACHLAYQPEFLPARSWEKIVNSLDKHFGADASLDEDARMQINKYLTDGSAEKSASRVAKKFLKSIGRDETPARISGVGYFKKEHRKIGQDVIRRKSVGSFSNCNACHSAAEKGNYDEDLVRIPKQ